jgi:hypothetical protein
MTQTLPGADIRGFYDHLGIALPGWSRLEAPARCFAGPDAHHRGDRDPSVSVNLVTGAWHCHGCGAEGGAFDAALARGHSPRSAIDLMIRFGLTSRRPRLQTGRDLLRPDTPRRGAREDRPHRRPFQVSERDVRRWGVALAKHPARLRRLREQRGWDADTIGELQLGLDRDRITIPIRGRQGELQGLLRYQPDHTSRPKMLAAPGSRLGLLPHPAAEPAEHILIVEGPPDMITARSCGACAIAVPGDHAWQPSWARLLEGRNITIVMDCDAAGRAAAERIAQDLSRVAAIEIVDLAPDRDDGYDLTDWLMDGAHLSDPASWIGHRHLPPTQGAAS